MSYLFRNLRVYQQALDFADSASIFTAQFTRQNWYLADQLNRASLSIALNIAEGTGRATQADRRRFLFIARGSVHECVALLDMCARKKLVSESQCQEFERQLITIGKMLAGMISSTTAPDSFREDAGEYGNDY